MRTRRMSSLGGALLATALLSALSGCAGARQKPLYYWGDYEDSIHSRYTAHDTVAAQEDLEAVIRGAEGGKGRVPPGVYADYGLLLYQRGNGTAAVGYFQKEAQAFPESAPLMEKLIARAGGKEGSGQALASTPSASSAKSQKEAAAAAAAQGTTASGDLVDGGSPTGPEGI